MILSEGLSTVEMRLLVLMFILLVGAGWVGSQQTDSDESDRCLLQTGGSTLRFFVSEDLPVGSVLGKLSVKGKEINLIDTLTLL